MTQFADPPQREGLFGRRNFLRGLLSVPLIVGMPSLLVPRPALPRGPYVKAGTTVGFIGLALHPAPTFIGSRHVSEVLPWNGRFYPCLLWNNCYGRHRATDMFPDHDLSDMNAEVPARFWASHSVEEWPNVHAWIRHRRFGEHPSVMRARIHAAHTGGPWVVPELTAAEIPF